MSVSSGAVGYAADRRAGGAGPRAWAALAVLMLPVLLISVDNTVLSFALPAISASLQPSGTALLWVVDIYPLLMAGLLVPMGGFGDRIGRRRLLLFGSVGFGAVSLLAAYSTSAELLILSRALLGVFGATLMPSTLSLLRNLFTDRRERRLAIAVWASAFAGGGALGPIVGGWLLEHFWWGSVFLLNVPVMAALVPFMLALVPESRDPSPGPFDGIGIGLVMAMMLPIVYVIKDVAEHGPSGITGIGLLIGVSAGTCFVRRQLRARNPMFDVRLFANATFSGAVGANLLSTFGFAGFLFFVSQFLQLVEGLNPMDAGFVLVPGLVGSIVAGLFAVRLVRYVRPHLVVGASFCLSAVGYAVFSLTGAQPTVASAMVAFTVLGVSIGLAETLTNDIIVATVPSQKAGAASGISETAYEVGSTLGVAILGSVLTAAYRGNVRLPEGLPPDAERAAGETLGGATDVAGELPGAAGQALLDSAHAAFDAGVQQSAACGIGIALLAALVSFAALRHAGPDDENPGDYARGQEH